jgi:septal ring factor EnvC (AmiA/AmiB activator)
VKRTPDAISKKRQELSKQIEALKTAIRDINIQIFLTSEKNKSSIRLKLAAYNQQLEALQKALKATQKSGKRFNLDYRKSLYPGVY